MLRNAKRIGSLCLAMLVFFSVGRTGLAQPSEVAAVRKSDEKRITADAPWQTGDPFSEMNDKRKQKADNLDSLKAEQRGQRACVSQQKKKAAAAEESDDGRVSRYIVKYKSEESAGNFEKKITGKLKKKTALPSSTAPGQGKKGGAQNKSEPMEVIELTEGVLPSVLASELKNKNAQQDIEYIQPDFPLSLESLSLTPVAEAAHIAEKKDTPASGGRPVLVAVLDTGMDSGHPALRGVAVEGRNIPQNSSKIYDAAHPLAYAHGTHVAGLVAAAAVESGATVKILPVQVFQNGVAYTSDVLAGIAYAREQGAQIINCSFGSTAENQALYEAIAGSSALFVCAAGNARRDLATKPSYPAAYRLPNVISVGSVNADGGYSYFSNYGASAVDITALGRAVDSALPAGKTGVMSGTSMAAGQVTGAAAAVWSLTEAQEASSVRLRVLGTADRLSHLQNKVGNGRRLNRANALSGTVSAGVLTLSPEDDFDAQGYQPDMGELFTLYSSGGVTQVSAGLYHTLALKADGTVWSWGGNSNGQLGDGTYTGRATPVQVVGLTGVTEIDAGSCHNLAVKSDGTVWAWGDNASGQLGNGSSVGSAIPVQVLGLYAPSRIEAGGDFSVAIVDGMLWSWGSGSDYRLGNGSTASVETPEAMPLPPGITTVAAGGRHALAADGGMAYGWGHNRYGQLGNGSSGHYAYYSTPEEAMSGVFGILALAAGDNHSLALTSDNTVWATGDNGGEINIFPWEVPLSNVTHMAAGDSHSLAIRSDGSVWAWGGGWSGQLGDGTLDSQHYPVPVSGLTGVTGTDGGGSHSVALKADGTVWTWGDNTWGQLGIGASVSQNTVPVLVTFGAAPSPTPTSMSLALNPSTVTIPAVGSTTATASAKIYDQFGDEMTGQSVTYSFVDTVTGVSIDGSTGVITVQSTAPGCTLTVRAVSGTLSNTTTLTLTKPRTPTTISLTVTPSALTISSSGKATAEAVARVYDQYGVEMTGQSISYSLAKTATGATINSGTGVITVLPSAAPGVLTVRAVSGNLSKTAPLTLSKPVSISVSGQVVWVDGGSVADRPATVTVQLLRDGTVIQTQTVSAAEDNAFTFTGLVKTDSQGRDYVYTVDQVSVPAHYKKTVSGTTIRNTKDKVYVKVVFWDDSENKELANESRMLFYGGGVTVFRRVLPGFVLAPTSPGSKIFENVTQDTEIIFHYFRAGTSPYPLPASLVLSVTPDRLPLPQTGTATATAVAQALLSQGQPLTGAVFEYSLALAYTGVSIDPNTGVITVTPEASEGTVTVKAGCAEKVATFTLTIGGGSGDPGRTAELSLNVTQGQSYAVNLSGSHLRAFAHTYTLTYDAAKLTLTDFAAQTGKKSIAAGVVAGTQLTNVSHNTTTGVLTFTVQKTLSAGYAWSGVLTVLRFQAKATGTATLKIQ